MDDAAPHRAPPRGHACLPRGRRAHHLLHFAIFPGITDVPAIIRRVKDQCNLIWLENLNLRGGYRKTILDYIAARHPSLMPLYEAIYIHGDRGYWAALDGEVRAIAAAEGLPYVRDDDSHSPPLRGPRRWWSTTSSTRRSSPSAKRAKARNGQK